jgi:glycosyltransferase involved in cell wall biosynthesis
VVRNQLVALGIDAQRIWLIPYGADSRVFHDSASGAPETFRIVFAGQVGVRKGLRTLLDALTSLNRPDWKMEFYGAVLGEARHDLDQYRGATPLQFHGPVSQEALATAFRGGSVLVLPSLEEGFGLVVPQALNCGMPAIVSDRVGGKDFVHHRDNGSIFLTGDAAALAAELVWWSEHPRRVQEKFGWSQPTEKLIEVSTAALS